MDPRRLALPLAALVLAACGSGGGGSASSTDCSLDGCTITFPRGEGSAEVSVLGVEARLDGVSGGTADLTVAGQDVSLDVGTSTGVGGLTVGVESVSDTEVVVRVTR
ncbi:hypothetical protein FHR75_002298 [Kineococcus radiotolerans]|uniref:Lipoprotein n=1 Tax=Kineococcus radiotolerans TaxID=131568 RepID=A0A7W4TMW3_KINRA|nr:hypothetical protein [Kineococcus radiotolerans]MBB2901483.1 hypothetical protein [Kineococcus radiotolerans]